MVYGWYAFGKSIDIKLNSGDRTGEKAVGVD